MANILCISREVILTDQDILRPEALTILANALDLWDEVQIFTRQPGISKRAIASGESAARQAGHLAGVQGIVRRLTFDRTRPPGSFLLTELAIRWSGQAVPEPEIITQSRYGLSGGF